MSDRFRPDAATRRVTAPEARGKRGDRIVIDDPHCDGSASFPSPLTQAFLDALPPLANGVAPVIIMARLQRPDPATFASETHKDRSGRHGTEVA